jgi:DNA-binding LacI/PurR family transcriptional regulator
MTKLADVARRAGVSQGTASNVFNRPALVRAEVRERVSAIARELGYFGADPKGRALRAGKLNAIGVVTADRLGYFFDDPQMRQFMTGVSEICDANNATISLVSGASIETAELGVKGALVDGLILHCLDDTARLTEIAKQRRLPFVVIDFDAGADVSSIRIDDREGARLAIRHLVGLGHRRFAILSLITQEAYRDDPASAGPVDRDWRTSARFAVTRERLLGFAEGLAEAGLDIDDMPIIQAPFKDAERTDTAAAILFDQAPQATAIVTMSALHALAVVKEAHRRGIDIPRALSVVAFDDVPALETSDPPLTTIAQPSVEKGRLAGRVLLEGTAPWHVSLPVSLVVRQSSAPPPSDAQRKKG